MAIDFSSIKKIQIPVKVSGETVLKYVKKIEDSSGATIWKGTYTITWKWLSAYSTWTTTTETYMYGEIPSRANPSTVTSGHNRKVFSSWDDLSAVTGDRTITATYTQQYEIYAQGSYCTPNKADRTWTWVNENSQLQWSAYSGRYFSKSSDTSGTTTVSETITSGGIKERTPSYVKCRIEGTNCTADKTDGYLYEVGTTITWTVKKFMSVFNYYSFEEGDSQVATTTQTVNLGTITYSMSAEYFKITVSSTNCTADVDSGFREIGATITWTAETGTNYKYSFSSTNPNANTKTATIEDTAAGTSYSGNASYLYYNVIVSPTTGYTADKESGYLLNNSTVTFTAPTNTESKRYAFSTEDSTIHTQGKTVNSAGQRITNDTAYVWMNCTFSGTHLDTKPTDDWYRVGTTQSFTAATDTNTKYAFVNATDTWADSYASTSVIIEENTTSYIRNASYIYYNVTVTPATNCSANRNDGYLLNDSKVTFTTTTATSTVRYSFSNSASNEYTQQITVSSAGQDISSGTVYTWYYITVNANTNSSVTANGTGWYRSGTSNTTTWTVSDSARYTFDGLLHGNQATVTQTWTADGVKTIAAKTVYARWYAVVFSVTSGQYGSWSSSQITGVTYGTAISRSGNTVTVGSSTSTFTKPSTTVEYNYGDPTYGTIPSTVTANTTISAGCARTNRTYTVKWVGADGTTALETDTNVAYNAVLTYNSATPTKAQTDQYTYSFAAWKLGSTSGSTVTSGTTKNPGSTTSTTINIYSTFTPTLRSYTVTFTNPIYGSWESTTKTAYYGDTLTVSGYKVTCSGTASWSNTCSANAQTTQYTYSLTGTVTAPSTVDGTESVTGPSSTRTERSYNVTFTNGTYGTWDSTTTISATYSTSISKSGNTVTVGTTNRTYTLPSNTAQYTYTTTINNASGTVGTGKSITATDARAINKYAVTITAGTGLSSAYLSTSNTATSGDASGTTYNYGTTVYGFVVLAEHYDVPADSNWVLVSGTMHETGSKYRVGSVSVIGPHNFGTFVAVIEKYNLSITKGTGISTIYYKVNGAGSYASTTSNLSVSVNDLSTYYYYATADNYHTVNADCGSSSSPKSGTVNCADISASVSTTAKTYKLVGTYTNGTVTWYSNSARTTVITQAAYGSTVYYAYSANEGYSGSGSGSLTLNTTDFTFAGTAAGSNATHNFGSATRLTWSLSITKSNYMSTVQYSIDGGTAVTVTGTTNLTGIDYASSVVVSGTKQSEAPYNYGAITGAGTFIYSATAQSTTVACTRSVKEYTLTISITNSSYGTCSVSRTSSPYQGAATGTLSNGAKIYYGDVLTGTSSGNGTSYGAWNITSVTAPTYTTTGLATSGNLTVTNKDSHTATLYYNTTSATGGTSLGSVASNASITKTGLSFNTDYYISARVSRSRDKYVDATDGSQYSGTASVTTNVTAAFAFKRTTSTDTGTLDSSVVSAKTAPQTTYTITFTREIQPSSAVQTLGTAVEDTSIGVGSVSVGWGGSYSQTFSKTNYVSQTKSGSNITANATVAVTLVPDKVNITQTDIANASESINYSWVYKDASYSVTQTVTPNVGYDYTANSVRYYNGKSYTRTITTPTTTSFGSLAMNQFDYTVSGGSSTNGTVAWTGSKKINGSATWTITANTGYTRPTNYTGDVTINSINFTLNEANKTAVYKSNFDPCIINSYAVTISATYCKSTYLSTNSTATSGSASGTKFNYNSTVYGFATLNDNTDQYTYTAASDWVQIGTGRTYRVGSTVVTTSGGSISVSANRTTNTYPVVIGATTYCKSAYLSTNASATSGSASGTSFNYGATVYLFVTLNDDNAQYTYTSASGWTQIGTSRTYRVASLTVGTSNTFDDISAVRTVNKYTVTFTTTSGKHGSWGTASITNVPYGTAISRSGNVVTVNGLGTSTFTKPSTTVEYNYGDPAYGTIPETVTGATTISAGSTRSDRTYTIRWLNGDGSVLETDSSVAYNATLTYNSSVTPSKESTAQYSYTFNGWKLGSTTVTSGTTKNPGSTTTTTLDIQSQFTPVTRTYTVTFSATNGSWSKSSITNVPYGTAITRSGNTVSVGSIDSSVYTKASTTVSQTAGDASYTVPSSVSGATTVSASTTMTTRTYTIKWIGSDGSTALETDNNVAYNAVLTYNGTTPTKSQTDQYTYEFSAWKLGSTSGSTVVSGTTKNPGSTSSTTINIYATFNSTERSYTVTFAAGTYGSWSLNSISALYSASISRSGDKVTVGSSSSTYSGYTATGYTTSVSYTNASGTVGTGKTITATTTRTANTYTLAATITNGSVKWYSDNAHTSQITSALYATTVYYQVTANTGYSGTTSGSFTLNTTNFTLSGSTATHNFGTLPKLTYTITLNSTYGSWKQGSTVVTQITNVEYGTAISKDSNVLTVGSTNYTFVANSTSDQYTYAFSSISWTPAGTTITGATTVSGVATRTERSYTVTFTKGTYGSWSPTSITALYSAAISISGDTVTVGSSTSTYSGYTATGYTTTVSYSGASGTVGTGKTITATTTRTANTYPLAVPSTIAATTWYSDSARTTQITSATYGNTVYYTVSGTNGYSGSITLNTTGFTLSGSTATANTRSVTVTGSNITTSGAGDYIYGAPYTTSITANSSYYLSAYTSGGSTGSSMTLNKTQTVYKAISYAGTLSSDKAISITATQYYTFTYNDGNTHTYGTLTYGATSSSETLGANTAGSTTGNNLNGTRYFTGSLTIDMTYYSRLTRNAGYTTQYYAADDRVITGTTGNTSFTSLGNNWLGGGTGYKTVTCSKTITNANYTFTVSSTDSRAGDIVTNGLSVTITNSTTSKSCTSSSNFEVYTPYSNSSTSLSINNKNTTIYTYSGEGSVTLGDSSNSPSTHTLSRAVNSYTLTLNITNPSYSSAFSASRTETNPYDSSKTAGVLISRTDASTTSYTATVYYGDKISFSATAKAGTDYGNWDVTSVTAPSYTSSTGIAVEGNLTIKNNDSHAVELYYKDLNSSSEKVTPTIASGGSYIIGGLEWNWSYLVRASLIRTRPAYTYSVSSVPSGTFTITGNLSKTISFGRSTGTDTERIYSSYINAATSPQQTPTVWGDVIDNVLRDDWLYSSSVVLFVGTIIRDYVGHLVHIKGTLMAKSIQDSGIYGIPVVALTSKVGLTDASKIQRQSYCGESEVRTIYGSGNDTYFYYLPSAWNGWYSYVECADNRLYTGRLYNSDSGSKGAWAFDTIGLNVPVKIDVILTYTD